MLHDYPNHTFTPDESEFSIDFKTGMKLTLLKFVMTNDLNFYTAPSLGFQIQVGDVKYPVRSFASFITTFQKDHQVVDVNIPIEIPQKCIATIKIVDQKGDYDYSITSVYDIQPL